MVNSQKVERKLPSLLIDESINVETNYSDYKKKQNQFQRLKRSKDPTFDFHFNQLLAVLDELDKDAERVGQRHIGFDKKGNFITYEKKR